MYNHVQKIIFLYAIILNNFTENTDGWIEREFFQRFFFNVLTTYWLLLVVLFQSSSFLFIFYKQRIIAITNILHVFEGICFAKEKN